MPSSVVVVAYRPHEWLAPCLASVAEQADEIVVVDNGSPGSEIWKVARAAGARVVTLPSNTGFPHGVNAGVAAAEGDVIALLNDDAMAAPGWLAAGESILADPAIGAVCPKLVFAHPYAEIRFDDEPRLAPGDARPLGRQIRTASADGVDVLDALIGPGIHQLEGAADAAGGRWRWTAGREPFYVPLRDGVDPSTIHIDGEAPPISRVTTVINSAGLYLTEDGYSGDRGSGYADDGQFDRSADQFGGCGGALMFRTETYARVGPLAGSFFAYYEDTDWCWRTQLAGLRIRYDSTSVVRHVGGVSTGGLASPAMRRHYVRNRLVCLGRNAPATVARREMTAALREPPFGLSRRQLLGALPVSLAQRLRLRRAWRRSAESVWAQWAGVGDTRRSLPRSC